MLEVVYIADVQKTYATIIGAVLFLVGMSLAFLPHALHTKVGLDSGTSHLNHIISGLVLLVIGLAILIYNNKALRIWNDKKSQ